MFKFQKKLLKNLQKIKIVYLCTLKNIETHSSIAQLVRASDC